MLREEAGWGRPRADNHRRDGEAAGEVEAAQSAAASPLEDGEAGGLGSGAAAGGEGSGDGEASPGPDQAMANATAMTQAMPLAKCHHANTQR